MTANELFTELEANMLAEKDTKYIPEYLGKYLGTSHQILGMSTAKRREILKPILSKLSVTCDTKVAEELLDLLSKSNVSDIIFQGGDILKCASWLRKNFDIYKYVEFLPRFVGWAEIDTWCQSQWEAKEVLNRWEEWQKLLKVLNKHPHISCRRASLVLLTKPARGTSDRRIFDLAIQNIEDLKHEKEVLITKAISWLLRSLVKNFKEDTKLYVEQNLSTLPKVAVRESLIKITTGRKTPKQ